MGSIFRPPDNADLIQRLQRLRPETKAQWGKMDAAQMLAHCHVALGVATGEARIRRRLMGVLFGKLAKKKLAGPAPFGRNLPTAPEFVMRGARDFALERGRVLDLVQRLGQRGPEGLIREPHPFFGPMTSAEWDTLLWKHLDHHLRQFGV